jgi:peptide deformylase
MRARIGRSIGGAVIVVGLCAPQLGYPYRIIAFRDSQNNTIRLLHNPIIETLSSEPQINPEGCLSSPGQSHNVSRIGRIKVDGFDAANSHPFSRIYSGLTAAIIQHEIDHLDGKKWPASS